MDASMCCLSAATGRMPSSRNISSVSSHISPSLKSTYLSTIVKVNASAGEQYARRLSKPSNEHTANTLLIM